MRITLEEVKVTAGMARIYLSDHECAQMQKEIDQVLSYATQLQQMDVQGVEPTTHAIPMHCPMRVDEVGVHFPLEVALNNAPQKEAAFFAVPTILTKEEG